MKKILRIILFAILFISILTGSVLAVTGTVTGTKVRIREGASVDSNEVSVAVKNEKVDVIGESGDWYQVNFENVTGYISKDYVDTEYGSNGSSSSSQEEPKNEVSEPVQNTLEAPSENTSSNSVSNETQNTVSDNTSNIVDSQTNPAVNATETQVSNEVSFTEGETVTFARDSNLRYMPNFSSRTSETVSSGASFTVREVLGNWLKVSNDTISGWTLKQNVNGAENATPSADTSTSSSDDTSSQVSANEENPNTTVDNSSQTSTSSSRQGKVNVDSARVRKTPDGEAIDTLSEGTEVTILGEEGDWYRVKTEDYDSCYVAKRLITES